MLGLALPTSAYHAGTLFIPASASRDTLTLMLAGMGPVHVLGVVVVGLTIERERSLHARERLLLRDADHDSLTGLLNPWPSGRG
jgi:hypothetical protein